MQAQPLGHAPRTTGLTHARRPFFGESIQRPHFQYHIIILVPTMIPFLLCVVLPRLSCRCFQTALAWPAHSSAPPPRRTPPSCCCCITLHRLPFVHSLDLQQQSPLPQQQHHHQQQPSWAGSPHPQNKKTNNLWRGQKKQGTLLKLNPHSERMLPFSGKSP